MFAQRKRDILEHVEIGEQRTVLKQHPHALPECVELAAREPRDFPTLDQHLAAVGTNLPRDQAQQRRFASAARTHDGGHAATFDTQVESRKNRATAD